MKISYTVIRTMLNVFDHFCTCVLMPYSSFSLLPALVLLDQEITYLASVVRIKDG